MTPTPNFSTLKKTIAATLLTALLGNSAWAAIPIQQWTQPNGARVYLVESPAIPMLDVQIDFDAGSRRDPADKTGLASVTASLLEKGVAARDGRSVAGPPQGATAPSGGSAVHAVTSVGASEPALDENALGEAWADLGASFDSSAGADRMSFSLRTLTDPALLDKAVALAARQIGEPAFPDNIWQRSRQKIIASLKESYTRPGSVAGRAYSKAVYGTHPYGNETTEASVNRISVADMRAFYSAGVVACRARISLVGAVTRAQADAIAARLLARLPQVPCASVPAAPAVPEVAALTQAEEKIIPFDSAQAQVLLGQPGYKRSDPQFFSLLVGNYILGGGGFVSRLANEVREKRGLTYSVSSGFSPGLHAGAFTIGLQTRPDQTTQALDVTRKVLRDFVADGPTEAELKAAKDNLIGGFALLIDSNRKLLGNISNIAWNNLPLNYLDTWTDRVNSVTVADVKAAFAQKLQPEKMVTVILGGKP
ncbi:MAG: pitrilysin family protein [Pseudomonadota bacterium]